MHFVLQENKKWDQAHLTVEVSIYDPFFKDLESSPGSRSNKISHLGYQQNIYWKAGELLVVETSNDLGELLHFYYESGGDVISVASQSKRIFSKMDILPHYFRFIVNRKEEWEKALQEVYVQGKEISLHHHRDFNVLYKVGDSQSEHFALIDSESFLLKELQHTIQGDGKKYLIRIVFQTMTEYKELQYPKNTEYFLDDRLFKRVFIKSIDSPAKIPLDSLRQKAVKWSNARSATFQIDYTK
ncbi:MAG: hypothetical protein HQM13_14635 [SAR324 cluster bacterium]|nr:hypothetical protein [SAR324 cluster bacterium]